eukprot:m.87797 g.87797  ORF g.87797 m.87797 type:complete len:256 (-) comp16424_c0_seq7:863-1630(-)
MMKYHFSLTFAYSLSMIASTSARSPIGEYTTMLPTQLRAVVDLNSAINSVADWQDDEYFGEYQGLKVHHEMLTDVARTECYKHAIEQAADFIKGKVVLDIGCGSGVLSMLAAKAGARHVYGVEASAFADTTAGIVTDNGLDNVVTILRGKIEGITLPEKADLIISEWMGTMLVFEFMIESVVLARDTWLADDGIMWPSTAQLFLAPVTYVLLSPPRPCVASLAGHRNEGLNTKTHHGGVGPMHFPAEGHEYPVVS